MKASIWTVSVVTIFGAVLLQAADLSYDASTATGMTASVAGLFSPFGQIIGLFLFVACAYVFINWFSGGVY
jgi:hypothetical protein